MKFAYLKRFIPYSLAVISMLVIGWAAWRLARHPDAGAYWSSSSGVIEWVQVDGPADDLLRPGERVLSIDGAPLSTTFLFSDKQPGDWVFFYHRS